MILSANDGKNLFIKSASFPWAVSTSVRFLFSMAFIIWPAHSWAVIIFPSSILESITGFAFSPRAAYLVLDAVKPGETHMTFTPVSNSSVRNVSIHLITAAEEVLKLFLKEMKLLTK